MGWGESDTGPQVVRVGGLDSALTLEAVRTGSDGKLNTVTRPPDHLPPESRESENSLRDSGIIYPVYGFVHAGGQVVLHGSPRLTRSASQLASRLCPQSSFVPALHCKRDILTRCHPTWYTGDTTRIIGGETG